MPYPIDVKPCPYCFNSPSFKFYGDISKWAFTTDLSCSFCSPFEKVFSESSVGDYGGLLSHIEDWNLHSSFHHKRILYYANQFARHENDL